MVRITEQVLRDGNQSLVTSRITTEDILPIADKLDRVRFFSLEVWSGSIFECCMRFLNEDPWERLRKIKDRTPNTPLKTLMRAQNLLGFRIFSDETVHQFVRYAVRNGCEVFSIFDSLNDTRNMLVPIQAVKKEGALVEACILYAISPVYAIDKFVQIGKELEGYGSDIFSIHDNAGILSPEVSFELVARLKRELKIPISLHFHCATGMASMSYLEGCKAGADILDTCISPLSGGTSLPPTEAMVAALMGTEHNTGYDLETLSEIKEYFSKLWNKYGAYYNRALFEIDMRAFSHQLPSGMLSHLIFQLNQLGAISKYQDVLREVPRVLEELGYPPLATPSSQIIAGQAAMNVITGKRYHIIPTEVKNYVRGMYGNPPGEISDEVKERVLGKHWREKMIQCRPAELVQDEYIKAEEETKRLGIAKKPEDVITYIFYPKLAMEFLSRGWRKGGAE
jgi:pyruvate/oxaloacetate carboxyltransferase